MELTDTQAQHIAKALADPRRQSILRQLGSSRGHVCCGDILQSQGVTAPTLSHHLKELERAGLISIKRDGKFAHIKLDRTVLRAYIKQLGKI